MNKYQDDNLSKILDRIESNMEELRTEMKNEFSDVNDRLRNNFLWMIVGFAIILFMIAHLLKCI